MLYGDADFIEITGAVNIDLHRFNAHSNFFGMY